MNLLYGEITEVQHENGTLVGRVRMGGACQRVPLDLVPGAKCGDKVLVCDGVAIGRVNAALAAEADAVSGNSGETA